MMTPIMDSAIKIPATTKYEWHIHEHSIEVDLSRPRKTKPDGVYMHPITFLPYRVIYGTIQDIADIAEEER